jgi:hypothetical protein
VREARIPDLTWKTVDDWRKRYSAADPEQDIEADWYRRLINPQAWLVPGYAEAAPMSDIQIWRLVGKASKNNELDGENKSGYFPHEHL